nr:50S ribosomal protein L32 [Bifidobacterium dentium]
MATPKNRTSRSRTRSRRAHWKTEAPQLATVTTPDGRTVQMPSNLAPRHVADTCMSIEGITQIVTYI